MEAKEIDSSSSPLPEEESFSNKEGGKEILDYLHEEHWERGMAFINKIHAITYFINLLRELFQGSDHRIRVMFAILYHLMLDERVRWTRSELDEKFYWLRPGQRNYLLQRLSTVGWLEYYRDQGVYMITDKGETLMHLLARLTQGHELVQSEGVTLAEIEFSLLLEVDDLAERLQFLHNRLLKHNIRAQNALESHSAYRILEIFDQLQHAYRWAEQTRQTLENLQIGEHQEGLWKIIRNVHDQLSKLHSQISEMQLVLQQIQKQQIHVARYGLTPLDYDHFLLHTSVGKMAALISRHLNKIPHPCLIQTPFAFMEARDVLIRDIPERQNLRGWETDVVGLGTDSPPQPSEEARQFMQEMEKAPSHWEPIDHLVAIPQWNAAAYRFQLLTMIANLHQLGRGHEAAHDPMIQSRIMVQFNEEGKQIDVPVHDQITYQITEGYFCAKQEESTP